MEKAQRQHVVDYLLGEGFLSPTVSEYAAWHIAPIISVWAVESVEFPGSVGWWAVAGDLPTDYTPCRGERHPRQALRDIGVRWLEAANHWSEDGHAEDLELKSAGLERELAPDLESRAKLFLEWAENDEIWADLQ